MADISHKNLQQANGIHGVVAYSYADLTVREAATGFVANDVNKLALQESDGTLWRLANHSPITWVSISDPANAQLLNQVVMSEFTLQDVVTRWDPAANTFADGVGFPNELHIAVAAGTVDFGSGNITFAAGDLLKFNGTVWVKITLAGGGSGSGASLEFVQTSPSKTWNTAYQNTTGNPMVVQVLIKTGANDTTFYGYVADDAANVINQSESPLSSYAVFSQAQKAVWRVNLDMLVPAGKYYAVYANDADVTILRWIETEFTGGGGGTSGRAFFTTTSSNGPVDGLVKTGNIDSVTRVSVGRYAVAFTVPESDAYYVPVVSTMFGSNVTVCPVDVPTVNGFTFFCMEMPGGTLEDPSEARVGYIR